MHTDPTLQTLVVLGHLGSSARYLLEHCVNIISISISIIVIIIIIPPWFALSKFFCFFLCTQFSNT